MRRPKKRVLIAGGVLLFIMLLALANYLSGVIFFITFFENPSKAGFLTIERAYMASPDARTMTRIQASAMIAFLLCVCAPIGLAIAWRKKSSDLFGKARFADMDDIQQEKLDAKKGLVLGKFKNELLRLGGYEFVLLAAPTRTGKGVGFCIPNLLQFQDSAVVLDIKGENYNLTSEFRRRYMDNEIVYFNPFSENTKRWNPLSYVSANPSFRANDLMAIATIIYPVNEKDPFWSDAAKNLFVGLGLLVLETPELPKTIGEILRQGSGKGNSIETYLQHVLAVRAAGPNPLSNACRDALGRFLGSGETALKGIVATFSASLTPFANDVIDKATSGDDFDLRDVRKKKMTIYLHIPAGEILQAAFIINLFFSQLINENVKELPEQNPDLKYQCLLLMDEFTAMGKVAIIAKGVGYMAGYNMRLAIVIQDKTQLESAYGKEDAHNIVSNMGAVIYFTPSQIQEAEEYSKMIGNDTVISDSMQRAKGTLFGIKGSSGDSKTASYQSRAVMLPQELLQMPKDQELVVRSGIPVIKAEKIRYFEDKFFKERFTAVPMQEVVIGGEKRKVPVPAKLPKGDWDAYYESIRGSDYYLRQAAPQSDQSQVGAGQTAGAAPIGNQDDSPAMQADAGTFELPSLPDEFESFHTLLARLKGSVSPQPISTTIASAFAESIIQYWQMAQSAGRIDDDAPLTILDLAPGAGQFAWQLMNALRERVGTLPQALPPIQYHACASDAQEQAALNAHPYFASLHEQGAFFTSTRADLLAGEDALSANPVVVVARQLFGILEQLLIDTHYGEMFGVTAKAAADFPSDANANELKLEYDWPPLETDSLSSSSAAVLEMYNNTVSSAVISLPSGALNLLDEVERIAGNRFLLLCSDRAVVDEREIRLGVFAPPSFVTVPAPPPLVNYHAIALHLRAAGASVWQEKVPDSDSCFCIALRDDNSSDESGDDHSDSTDTLSRLQAPLAEVHGDDAQRLAEFARKSGKSLPNCLSLLKQADHDPQILGKIYPVLETDDWKLTTTTREHWQAALARTWSQYLPQADDEKFFKKMVFLARKVSHYGLARMVSQRGADYCGRTDENLCRLAECELQIGRTEAAAALVREVLEQSPDHEAATALMTTITTRLQTEQSLDWYVSDQAQTGALHLEPLGSHHADQYYYQYRDPQIGVMAMLPKLKSLEEAKDWINQTVSTPTSMSCAVMHEDWGLVGFVCMQRASDDGFLSFWVGADHQGHGYGVAAVKAFLDMLRGSGVEEVFASSFRNNPRALRALNSMGFHQLDRVVDGDYGGILLFHRGTLDDEDELEDRFYSLCESLS
ncbi:GNAT family N-acetyltransferase [Herbaspirillum sp. ST 5-3]|uniref:GNAT family N-acetyltransferase n=1 Tax=Oxalobacteraceae TaxID=75682 RepID=UPI0010A30154|nr:GNAT family N-acetyltransferase [Herbaspirillum sp. ST 5-3]